MKVKVGMHVDNGGDLIEDELELPDNATQEQIEQEAKEWAWNYIDLWWEREGC